jgi:hypothetical protein
MKYTTTITILGALTLSLNAATYAFNNGSSATANGITASNGNAFRSGTTVGQTLTATGTWGNWTSAGPGVIAVGRFNTDSISSLTSSELIAAFTGQFGTTYTFGAGVTGQRGTFAPAAQTVAITGNTSLSGFNMYLFAGNGATFAESTQFLVLKHNTQQFLASDDSVPTAITVQFLRSNTTTLFGTDVANVPTTNSDASTTPGWAMAAPIPETSTSLLGAIGALALLRRRRN